MKIALYYFSGTGNTAWMVNRLAEALTRLGDSVTARSCETLTRPGDLAAVDALGLAFPTAASYAPPVFSAFIETLPEGQGMPLFAVTTAAYASGDTAWYVTRPLEARGYAPFLLANVLMPNNFFIPPMAFVPIPSPARIARYLQRAQQKIDRLAGLIHARTPHVEGTGLGGRLLGLQQRWGMDLFAHRLFKPFFADERCTRCGWCVRHCPVANIRQDEAGIHFDERCILCMRCYSFCPVQAIQAAKRTRNVRRYPRYGGPEGRPYAP